MTVLLAALAGVAAAAGLAELLPPHRRHRTSRTLTLIARIGARAAAGIHPAAQGLEARAQAAGIDRPANEIVALQAGLALLATTLAAPVAALAPGRLNLAVLLAAPVAGYALPEHALRRRARARAHVIETELPDVLDLLRVALQAGLAPRKALAEVGRRHPGLLAKELEDTAHRIRLGEPAAHALSRLEARCPGTAGLIAALERAERHGAPLAATLHAQATQARAHRAAERSEQAAKAAPKIQLVVALLLVPAVLLLIAAAVIPALPTR